MDKVLLLRDKPPKESNINRRVNSSKTLLLHAVTIKAQSTIPALSIRLKSSDKPRLVHLQEYHRFQEMALVQSYVRCRHRFELGRVNYLSWMARSRCPW